MLKLRNDESASMIVVQGQLPLSHGDRVFAYMQGSKTGKACKLACIYHGPYRVVTALGCGVDVRPVDKPNATPICVALSRIRWC